MSAPKPTQQEPVTDEQLEAPTAKREIPQELRDEASPATPRPHATIRLNQADIDTLLKRERDKGDDGETTPSSSDDEK